MVFPRFSKPSTWIFHESNEHPINIVDLVDLISPTNGLQVWVVAKYGRLRLCEVELFTEPLPTVTQVGQLVKQQDMGT